MKPVYSKNGLVKLKKWARRIAKIGGKIGLKHHKMHFRKIFKMLSIIYECARVRDRWSFDILRLDGDYFEIVWENCF